MRTSCLKLRVDQGVALLKPEGNDTYDAIVAGGGPAGCTAASLLSRAGHRVLLLEKEEFPRTHVGESLLPFCYGLFDDLGVRDEMARRFVRKPGVRFVDRDGNASTTWCFSQVIDDESFLSFQVDRSQFDQILLDNARRLGVEVQERVRVEDVDLSDPAAVVVGTANGSGGKATHHGRFFVDATGRDALLGGKLRTRTPREELDRTALWAHWDDIEMRGGLEEGNSLIVYVGEEKKGWIWIFPLNAQRITAGAVMQNSYMRGRARELRAGGDSDWKTTLMYEELRSAPFVRDLLVGGRQAIPTQTAGNYSYTVGDHYGPNYAMIGDARGFIDPIFSSGVFLSMKTAYLVSDAIQEQLSDPKLAGSNDRMAAAYEIVNGAYEFVHRMIRLFYSPHSVTWAQVGADKELHTAAESAMAAGHYMLAGDFFENHRRYNKFFELLEDPNGFRRYAKHVLARPRYQELSCHIPWEVAFGGRLERFTPEQAAQLEPSYSS
jgi:flavin-dependent dehydrogenase